MIYIYIYETKGGSYPLGSKTKKKKKKTKIKMKTVS